jgi:hypothetical protein
VANSIQSASRGERGALDRTDDGDQHRADEDLQTVVDGLMRETRERAARCHVVRLRDLPADRWPRQVYCPAAGCGWPVSIGTADDDEQCARCRRPTKSDAERGELLALLPAADYPGAGVLKPAEDPTDVAAGLVAAVLDPAHRSGQDLAAVAAAQLLAGEPRERVGQALAELTRKPHWQPRWLPAFVTALPASAGTGVPAWEQLTDYSPRF